MSIADNQDQESGLLASFAKVTGIVAAFGAVGFVIGLAYNYGYFYDNLNWFTYLTWKDHLASIVFFAVPVFVVAAIIGLWLLGSFWFDWLAAILIVGTLALWWEEARSLAAQYEGFARLLPAFKYWGSFFAISYFVAIAGRLCASLAQRPLPRTAAYLVLTVLALVIFLPIYGYASYQKDVNAGTFETLITDPQTNKSERVHVLRTIDEGAFIVRQAAPDHIVFVKELPSQDREIPK